MADTSALFERTKKAELMARKALAEAGRLRSALQEIVTIYDVDRRPAHLVALRMANRAGEALGQAHD